MRFEGLVEHKRIITSFLARSQFRNWRAKQLFVISYVRRLKKIKVEMTATLKEQVNHFSGETQGLEPSTKKSMSFKIQTQQTTGEKEKLTMILVTVSADNPYITAYTQVGFKYIIGDIGRVRQQTIVTGDTFLKVKASMQTLVFIEGLVQKSNESEPEHSIVYVNEVVPNARVPIYNNLTIAGLSLEGKSQFYQP